MTNIKKSDIVKFVIYIVPFIVLLIIKIFPGFWRAIFPKNSFSFIFDQLTTMYNSSPFATIAIIASALGISTTYYGVLLRSETKYSKLVEEIEARLRAIGFLNVIPNFCSYRISISEICGAYI